MIPVLSKRTVDLLRVGSITLGVLLAGAVLFGPIVGIGSPDGVGVVRILALVPAALLLTFGIAGRDAIRAYRAIATILLNTLLLVLMLELAAAVILPFIEAPPQRPAAAFARHSSYYKGQSWADQLWQEQDQLDAKGVLYSAYVLTRWPPFEGRLIRLDENGFRRTPGSVCQSGSYQIFFFGGSTGWGFGAPDWGTIPAYLVPELRAALGREICMRNFAQMSFVSTQNLIQLLKELQGGRIPDLVISYGGVNDMIGGWDFGEPGPHWGMRSTAARMEARQELGSQLRDLRWSSNLYRALWNIKDSPAEPVERYTFGGLDSLAQGVVKVYSENHHIASALGRDFGFRVATFWQPNLVTDPKPLQPEEVRYAAGWNRSMAEKTVAQARVMARQVPDFYDISDVFAGHSEEVYIDWHHITPDGNRLVAHAIAAALRSAGMIPAVR